MFWPRWTEVIEIDTAPEAVSIEEHWPSAHWAARVRVQVATGNGIYRIPVQQGLGVTSPEVRTDCASGNTRTAIAVAVHAPPARAVWIVIVAGHNLSPLKSVRLPTENTFITSSPRWLMTFTAIRPDFGLAKEREVSE